MIRTRMMWQKKVENHGQTETVEPQVNFAEIASGQPASLDLKPANPEADASTRARVAQG